MEIPFGEIAVRSRKDPRFRKALVSTPDRALRDAFGIEPPKGHRFEAVEDTSETVHLIVPASEGSRGAEVGIVGEVLRRLRSDKEFRTEVMERPRQTFERITGVRLPDQPRFVVLRDTESVTHVQIPTLEPDRGLVEAAEEAAESSYGGDGGGYGGGGPLPESPTPECTSIVGSNSSQAICCASDFPNVASAFDCCFDDETPDAPDGGGRPVLMPF